MEQIKTMGGYLIDKPIDIILITCNRLSITRVTIDELYKRIKTPFRLIVVDDMSIDGTYEYLLEQKGFDRIDVLEQLENSNICQAYNKGFEFVESDYFITMQDDITIPDLEPCVIQQMIDLIEKYPDHSGIGLRIQRIPNLLVNEGNDDLIPARKSLSAYFRIQHRKNFDGKEFPFGNRDWDDRHFVAEMKEKRGLKCSWTRNIWADHSRGYCLDRGYIAKPRKWGTGIHSRTRQAHIDKPYPSIDFKTCIPLSILNANKKVNRPVNKEVDMYGFKVLTRRRYYDENILKDEFTNDVYRIPENIKVLIDVGAHIGGTTMMAAKMGAIVYSFEPESYSFELLQYNVRRNRFHDRVHCINYGIGEHGSRPLYIHRKNSGATSAFIGMNDVTDELSQTASFITLKEAFDNYGIEHCTVLKLDCEGGEDYIIRSLDDEMTAKIDQVSVEFHEKQNVEELIGILSKWYDCENVRRYEWVCRRKKI